MDVSTVISSSAPAGTSISLRGNTVPFGYLREDGSVVSRVTYGRLFEAIGTLYGAGDGTTTFALPNSKGRVDVASGQGSSLTDRTLGQTGGEENHLLTSGEMPSHTHTQNAHTHPSILSKIIVPNVSNFIDKPIRTLTPGTTQLLIEPEYLADTTATNQNTGGGGTHNNMQPYIVAMKAIKF